MRIDAKTIEGQVVSHYIASGDYNGLPLHCLASDLGVDPKSLAEVVVPLVKSGRVSLPSPFQTNPHVKAFKSSIEEQLRWFDERESRSVCLYPTAQSIAESIDLSTYDDRPFTKLMLLANPKLLLFPFDWMCWSFTNVTLGTSSGLVVVLGRFKCLMSTGTISKSRTG